MKHNILSLFMGLGMCAGLLASPSALYAQEDMSAYDIDIDLTSDDIDVTRANFTLSPIAFSNEEHLFTDSTGCVTGGDYLYVKHTNTRTLELPIDVKGHNVWAGTYDVYVVVVPSYYNHYANDTLSCDTLKNKIRFQMRYLESISGRETTIKGRDYDSWIIYEGLKVDSILAFQDVVLPMTYYKSYSVHPTITLQVKYPSTSERKDGFSSNLCIDRVILKAKSVTPGETLFEGILSDNISYKLDAQTGTLTCSGSGLWYSGFPDIEEYPASGIRHVVIEEGITGIGFNMPRQVVSVSLPNGLKSIGDHAFENTLISQLILPATVERIGDYAFCNTPLSSIEIPSSVVSIGNSVFSGTLISSLTVPASVEYIGDNAFSGSCLSSITFLGDAVTSIGDYAFYGTPLSSIEIPSSVTSIGDYAFAKTCLKRVEIPEGVKSIGSYAFTCKSRTSSSSAGYLDEQLESIKLPNSLESIGENVFTNSALTEIVLPSGLTKLGTDLFKNTPLHKVWWNVRAIEDFGETDPFLSVRSQIDTLYIGETAEVLPNRAFESMRLRDFVISENVHTIGARCFAGVPMFSVNISASVKSIGDYAFTTVQEFNVAEGNTAYTDVDGVLFSKDMTELVCYPHARAAGYRIPDGVKKISNWAFGNNELTNVYIPASVNSLSLDMFTAVRTLTVAWKTAAELPELSFSAETYPMLVQVPYGSNEVYQQAEGWKLCSIVNEYLVGNALAEKPTFSVFQQMMEATGWNKALMAYEDEEYAQMYNEGKIEDVVSSVNGERPITVPAHRYYGYTVFAERNAVYETLLGKAADAITLRDLTTELAKYYEGKTDEDYASEDHVLNRFVSYHLLPVKLPYDRLVIHWNEKGYNRNNKILTIPVMEYYETMGKGRRLMKMTESAISNGVRINRFMKMDNTYYEIPNSGAEGIAINKDDADNDSYLNGYVYALNELLVYDNEVRSSLANERMRYDMASLFPELVNNNMRLKESTGNNGYWGIPNNYPYLENLTIAQETNFAYLPGVSYAWYNYQGDEFNVTGDFDVTIKLPAVPESGTYELRMGVQNNTQLRGIAQAYVGNDKENLNACGLPIDFRKGGNTTEDPIGWVADGSDEVINQLNDLRMREKGFMKGPEYYTIGGRQARDQQTVTRRVIGQFYFEAGKTYYMRLKSCLDDTTKELYLDYIELVPKSVYDNPNEPEDRW